jgi:hypothetical protein
MAKTKVREIPLSEAIAAIRKDLLDGVAYRKKDWKPMFDIEDLEIELQVRLARTVTGKVGAKVIVEFGLDGARTDESIHKVKVRLKPLKPESRKIDYGDPHSAATVQGGPKTNRRVRP